MGVTQMMMMLLEPLIFALRAIDLLYDTAFVSGAWLYCEFSFLLYFSCSKGRIGDYEATAISSV
jgi:hypothetical protein